MMKLFLNAVAILVLTLITLGAAHANDRPVLRSQVMTLSEIVTIGDFYSNAGSLASVPLFRSPDLGTSGNVDAKTVSQHAQAAGLTQAGTDGLRTVVVHRGATKYNRSRLEHIVRTSLAERHADVIAENLEISFSQAPTEVLADPKVQNPIQVNSVEWTRNSGRFSVFANVAVENGTRQILLSGKAMEMVEITALAQPLRRGDILRSEDLVSIRFPKHKVTTAALLNPDDIIGKEARVNMRANQPLARKNFQRPILIKKGEKVTVIFELPGMKLTSRALALDSGAKGDVIDVSNIQSRRVVPATITSRGQVRVHAANPVIASLNSETN